jgi:hypothetical protein
MAILPVYAWVPLDMGTLQEMWAGQRVNGRNMCLINGVSVTCRLRRMHYCLQVPTQHQQCGNLKAKTPEQVLKHTAMTLHVLHSRAVPQRVLRSAAMSRRSTYPQGRCHQRVHLVASKVHLRPQHRLSRGQDRNSKQAPPQHSLLCSRSGDGLAFLHIATATATSNLPVRAPMLRSHRRVQKALTSSARGGQLTAAKARRLPGRQLRRTLQEHRQATPLRHLNASRSASAM